MNALVELLGQADDENVPPKIKLDLLNKLIESNKDIADISTICKVEDFIKILRIFLTNPAKTIRTGTLKVLRQYTKTPLVVEQIMKQNLHYFIIKSLEKGSEQERIQAIKLIRQIISVECSLMPRAIVQGLKALAEVDDPFNRVCLDALCEIAIRNPRVVAHCNGFKAIFNGLIDPNLENMQESLVLTVLFTLDEKKTRCFVRPGYDLRIALAPLTDTYGPEVQDKEKRWKAVTKAVLKLLKSWTGVIALTSDNHGLKNLIDALYLPSVELKDIILDGIYEIFHVAIPRSDPFKQEYLKADRDVILTGGEMGMDLTSRTLKSRHNILDNYISALLIAFIRHGLIEALIELGNGSGVQEEEAPPAPAPAPAPAAAPAQPGNQPGANQSSQPSAAPKDLEKHKNIPMKATILLGELLHLSNTLLPTSQCAHLQTLPTLVKHAAAFNLDARMRSRSSSMITSLHQYAHLKSSTSDSDFNSIVGLTGSNKWKRLKGRDRRLDKIDDVKLRIDIQMDDSTFQNKIRETQVTVTKDWQRWNWDIISDLLEGPLNNPQHVGVALKNKFIKRLLSFLRPTKKMFINMPWTNANMKYARIGCKLLEVLLACDSGAQSLESNNLIPEVYDLLKSEVEARDKKESPLTQQKILRTMVREYFTLLGTLSSSQKGSDLMIRFRIFDQLLPMAEMGRSDLTNLIMTSLDYNIQTESCPSRVLLQKALTSSSTVVRFRATRYLRALLRSGVNNFADWGVRFLVNQLNDPDAPISREALSVLDEACDDSRCLESLIEKKPYTLLCNKGRDLLLRFLSSPAGYKYLSEETGFIPEEMANWKKQKYMSYVANLEASISDAFSSPVWRKKLDQSDTVVHLPPHFYGELVKTSMGCQLFKNSGHFNEFFDIVNNKNSKPIERRGALWVLGHVGATPLGLKFLLDINAVPMIVDLTEKSSCLSLRGTGFYVLGLLSSTDSGREILDSLGWESDSQSHICIPKDLKTSGFLTIPSYKYKGSWALCSPENPPFSSLSATPSSGSDGNAEKEEIRTSVINISNHISSENASRVLRKLKTTNPEFFTSASLTMEVFRLMENYFYRLAARRFLYDLFSTTVFTQKDFEESIAYNQQHNITGSPPSARRIKSE